MADNRKYYYLKLKENFFDSDSIVLLEDMKDGILYSNILLKLYLKSLKNGGKLQLDEHIPYTAQMIATLTRHQIGTVERALEIFRQLGLVEQLDSGAFYMTDIELMIGQSSTEAERKRAARLENKALLPPRTKGGHLSDIRPPEIEIELEKEIEIEKEREGETGHPTPAAYGRYNNVILTDTELSGLKTELPDKWEYYIDRLSCHIASHREAVPQPCSHHLQVGAGGRCQRQGCPETGHTRLFMQGGRELMKNEIEAMITDITHYRRSGGLHRRGRAFILRQVPYAQRSLFFKRNRPMVRA